MFVAGEDDEPARNSNHDERLEKSILALGRTTPPRPPAATAWVGFRAIDLLLSPRNEHILANVPKILFNVYRVL